MRRFAQLLAKVLLVTALSMAAWLFIVRHSDRMAAASPDCRVDYVYDGDTIAMSCNGRPEVTARLQGFDTPETKEPGCDAELAHGALATDRLRVLVKSGEVTIRRVGRDKYNRPLIRLDVDGEDVGDILIREGLAVAYRGGARIDWCARLEGA